MKTVFTNRQCAHVWAQQNQPAGRSDNMHFEGGKLYSYRTLIANVVRAANGAPVALFTSRTYSVTTSGKHMSPARNAWAGAAFVVPNLDPGASGHAENVEYLAGQYNAMRDRLMRAPCTSRALDDAQATLQALAHTLYLYRDTFGVDTPTATPGADAERIIARRDLLLSDPRAKAKREADKARREARELAAARLRAERYADMRREWLAGMHHSLPYGAVLPSQGDLLRVKGDEVQTSRGAAAPLADVRRALRVYRLAVNSNALPWARGDFAQQDADTRLGHFTLDAIDTAGNVRAGCHTILRAEVERLAATLEVQP